jgi:hypothetical protein
MLEEDDNFRRWAESMERGSTLTASVYFRRMGLLCLDLKVTPAAIAAMSAEEARGSIHDAISSLEGPRTRARPSRGTSRPSRAALKIKGSTFVTATKIREEIKQAIVTAEARAPSAEALPHAW